MDNAGAGLQIGFDTACGAADYHLLYGDLAGVSSYGNAFILASGLSLGALALLWTALPRHIANARGVERNL